MLSFFVFNTFFPVTLVLEVGMGAAFMIEYTMINTLLQTRVEDAMRGRVLALYTITFLGFAPFGNLALGALRLADRAELCDHFVCCISLVLSQIVFRRVPRDEDIAIGTITKRLPQINTIKMR